MKNWFNGFNNWISQLANSRWSSYALFMFAFLDASFLPLPSTTFFLILILFNTHKTNKYVILCILGTLTGAFAGYSFGHFAWYGPDGEYSKFVQLLFNHLPGFSESAYNKFQLLYAKLDFWLLCLAASTPIPYSIFAVFSGVFKMNVFVFLLATFISQSIKFSFLAFAALKLGTQIQRLARFRWKPVIVLATVFTALSIFILNTFKSMFYMK